MKRTPLDAPFGAIVDDVDLATLSQADADRLSDWLLDSAWLLFRRQSLTDLELQECSGRFGKLEIDANHNAHSPVTPHVTYMSNLLDEGGRIIGGLGSGEVFWHSDQFFRRHPATLAALYAVEVPPSGGDTSWCSTVSGYDSLPAELRKRITGLRARYQPQAMHTIAKQEVTHPLVLDHPTSDRKSLYIFERCLGVEGMAEEESRRLIEELLGYQLNPAHIYRHRWRPGDVVLYDNGQTLHRREAFQGLRLMKSTRVFLPPDRFPVPD